MIKERKKELVWSISRPRLNPSFVFRLGMPLELMCIHMKSGVEKYGVFKLLILPFYRWRNGSLDNKLCH